MTNFDNQQVAKQLRDRAIEFIRANETHGLWPPAAGAMPNAMTSAEVLCAAGADLYQSHSALEHAKERLLSLQRGDGSWTDPNDDDPWDCSATAWAVWAIRDWPEANSAARQGKAFLLNQMRPDGGIATNEKSKHGNTYASAYAWRALAGYEQDIKKISHFLSETQNSDGGWGLTAGAASEPTLTMYVLDGLLTRQDHLTAHVIDNALSWLIGIRAADGTFGSWLEAGKSVEGTAFGLHILRKAHRPFPSGDRLAAQYILERLRQGDAYSIDGKPQIWVAVSILLAASALQY